MGLDRNNITSNKTTAYLMTDTNNNLTWEEETS